MASKYGIAFSKSGLWQMLVAHNSPRLQRAFASIVSFHKSFWEYTQDYFSGNKWGDAYTKQK